MLHLSHYTQFTLHSFKIHSCSQALICFKYVVEQYNCIDIVTTCVHTCVANDLIDAEPLTIQPHTCLGLHQLHHLKPHHISTSTLLAQLLTSSSVPVKMSPNSTCALILLLKLQHMLMLQKQELHITCISCAAAVVPSLISYPYNKYLENTIFTITQYIVYCILSKINFII